MCSCEMTADITLVSQVFAYAMLTPYIVYPSLL